MNDYVVRRVAQAALDAAIWLVAVTAATWFRYDFSLTDLQLRSMFLVGLLAGGVQVAVGLALRLYQGRYVYGSFDQVVAVVLSAASATVVTATVMWLRPQRGVPVSAVLIAGISALLGMLALRYAIRAVADRRRRPSDSALPVLVLGAGDAGEQLVRGIQRDPRSPYRVVAILDDARTKRHLTLSGIPVRGGRELLVETARATGARAVIVAIADASPELLHNVVSQARTCGIDVKTIPSLAELVNATVDHTRVRDLDVTDFLRRRPIATDTTDISRLLHGKRVLVTGAGGSIGSELSRQVHAFGPAKLFLLDRDESALHSLQLSLSGQALLDDDSTVLADIRDACRMQQLMSSLRPDVVFHAAALKHLPLLERNPTEAVKTNVIGTQNVLDAAAAAEVPIFVNISTDKAADPISVLGYSKRITERLTAATAEAGHGSYVSVRFGNVLGSRGSVLTSFSSQIAHGGPVTVTDPEVTRYFMTIPEAVQLVLQASTIGSKGDALVLDMGEPVRIVDVARQMIEHSGRDIDIVFTGLRDGEKLDEALYASTETARPTSHPLISRVHVPGLCRESLDALNHGSDGAVLIQSMELLSMGPVAMGHDDRLQVQ